MAHEENKAFLRRVPLFSGLTEPQLENLAGPSRSPENGASEASLTACQRVLAAIAHPVRTV